MNQDVADADLRRGVLIILLLVDPRWLRNHWHDHVVRCKRLDEFVPLKFVLLDQPRPIWYFLSVCSVDALPCIGGLELLLVSTIAA